MGCCKSASPVARPAASKPVAPASRAGLIPLPTCRAEVALLFARQRRALRYLTTPLLPAPACLPSQAAQLHLMSLRPLASCTTSPTCRQCTNCCRRRACMRRRATPLPLFLPPVKPNCGRATLLPSQPCACLSSLPHSQLDMSDSQLLLPLCVRVGFSPQLPKCNQAQVRAAAGWAPAGAAAASAAAPVGERFSVGRRAGQAVLSATT